MGHGRAELAEAAAKQAETLEFFPLWSYVTPPAIELADRLAGYAPGDLNKVFFTTGGGEAVESAWKLAKQYFKLVGKPGKFKVISRAIAYHGTPQGALAITGLPDFKKPFEPLTPGGFRVPNTNFYRAPEAYQHDARPSAGTAPTASPRPSSSRARTRCAPSSWSRCRTPAAASRRRPGTSSGSGRSATSTTCCWSPTRPSARSAASARCSPASDLGYVPDIITTAKGMSSGYSPIGAMIATDRLFEPFSDGKTTFGHGYTFGGHPVSAAVALANLDIFEREGINDHVKEQSPVLRATLEQLLELPIVGDVRGEGFFFGIELVKDKDTKETFDESESERLLRGFLSTALFEAGLYCRADDRGDPVVQLAPPLICGQAEFDEI